MTAANGLVPSIIILTSNPHQAENLHSIFSGYHVIVLSTVKAASEYIADHPISVVLQENGFESTGESAIPVDLKLDLPIPQAQQALVQSCVGARSQALIGELHYQHMKDENQRLSHELDLRKHLTIEMNFLKDVIVRNVAHELRTPLLQVKSAVSLLAEDVGKSNRVVELALEATTRLESGVQNVTMLNELMRDSLDIQYSAVSIEDCVQYALRNLRRSWEHRDQLDRIQLKLDNNLPPVWGDGQRLGIVFQLLIENALKFSAKRVAVSGKQRTGGVEVEVKDQGIGISSEQLSRIFEPFYQVDGSSTRRYGGMGIGLAIVRAILERHQTVISVKSQVGKGSTFTFRLPLAP